MNLIQESYGRLFPEKEFLYQTEMEYNRRLGNFNANIHLRNKKIKVNLNLQWKDIDEEIKIGLIQHLLLKILRKKKNTVNIDLYNNFIKNIPILTPKTEPNPVLLNSFNRVNAQFFYGILDQPNLEWGRQSYRKLASYNFHNDKVTVSTLFTDARMEVLDYLMYHELLHKHHKFKHNNGRSSFHTRAFREDEKKYPSYDLIEKEIDGIIRSRKRKFNIKKSFWKNLLS